MIVVAIIGILAAIALPAYQDYTIRSKVSEALVQLDGAKVGVAESAASNARLAAVTAANSGFVFAANATTYVASVTIANDGVITATTQNTGAAIAPCWCSRRRSQVDWTSPFFGHARKALDLPSTFRRAAVNRRSIKVSISRLGASPPHLYLLRREACQSAPRELKMTQ
jgi:Tfp pilus assembly major pilin PilA